MANRQVGRQSLYPSAVLRLLVRELARFGKASHSRKFGTVMTQ